MVGRSRQRVASAQAPARAETAAEEQRLRTTFLRLRSAVNGLLRTASQTRTDASRAFHEAERDAARQTHRQLSRSDAEALEAYEAVRSVLLGRAGRLAPGPASADWDEPQWRSVDWLGTTGARYARIGSFAVLGATPDTEPVPDLPALVPLLDSGNLALVDAEDALWPWDTVTGVVLRALAAVPAGRLEVVVFDPRIRGLFSGFTALRGGPADVLAESIATPTEFAERLHDLRNAVARVAELTGAHGVADLGSLTEATGVQPEPYRLVVVLDYPYGVDATVQRELARLADGGPRRGVSLLVHHDPRIALGHDIVPSEILSRSTVVNGRPGALSVNVLPGVTIRPDPAPPRELTTAVTNHVAEKAHRGAAPSVDFAALLPAPNEIWTKSAVEGLAATVGTSGMQRVAIDLRGADPALPNALIGGASGQGKSNLLLVMLHSIAANYSPAEVEMYLLDFKDGLEFDRLGPRSDRPHWMPQVRVLGLEGDRLFGLAVLRHLEREFRVRAEKFRASGANHIGAYRESNPIERVPRILLVIDEFQVLIGGDDDITRESVGILETLARRGRAVGIHLVLASQTLSGIEALATKERSIFGQFPWRVSLKTEASESEAILGRLNTEAARLRFRGEAVINSEYGSPEHNRRAMIAYADERVLEDLRNSLWRQAGALSQAPLIPPQVFYASRPSDPANLRAALTRMPAADDESRHALVGMPIDVDPRPATFPLRPDPGRTLALIGDGRQDALGVLTAATWSLAAQHKPGEAEFVFVDALSGGVTEMAELAAAAGQHVTVHSGQSLGTVLVDLASTIDARLSNEPEPEHEVSDLAILRMRRESNAEVGEPLTEADAARLAELEAAAGPEVPAEKPRPKPMYIVVPGMHRGANLERTDHAGNRPADALEKLVTDGPIAEVYLLGWWSTLSVFQQQLGFEASRLVGGYVFLRVPESDVQWVCGHFTRYQARDHRGLLFDRTSGGAAMNIVPFGVPDSDQLDILKSRR